MSVVPALLGIALVLSILRDLFHEFFHPAGAGSVSGKMQHGVWRTFRRVSRRCPALLEFAGPAALVTVLLTWVSLLVLGWALVYWSYLPEAFSVTSGLDLSGWRSLGAALYLSLMTITTLGYGDITPTVVPLQVLATLEALVGFALLTAGITWVLSIYPALSRRRALAHHIALLRAAGDSPEAGRL